MSKRHVGIVCTWIFFLICGIGFFQFSADVHALNMLTYKDTITDSKPNEFSDHALSFTLNTDIAAGGSLTLIPPADFEILSTSTFGLRNVELEANGSVRTATGTLSGITDQIIITPGTPGQITYNLNTTTGLSNGDSIVFRIGANTSNATEGSTSYSSTTGTTTIQSDIGIKNASTTGMHKVLLQTSGGTDSAYARFVIFLVEGILIEDVDTTEVIPPVRFNGAPSTTIGGTTLSVEMSLETNEFAVCKYGTVASTSYALLPYTYESTGLVVHTQELTVVNETSYTFYVRCIDDEGNFNIDDYIVTFDVPEVPTGTPNDEGETEGSGTGSGDSGSGTGNNSGGNSGSSGTGNNTSGGSSGGGGSGGGGGGSKGDDNEDDSGGGFGNDAPYESGDAQVIFNGYAFPGSTITILVDGNIAETGTVKSDGKFSITIDEIARGVYTFGIYAVDTRSVKSSTFSTTFSVQGARTSNLSNIHIVPSIDVDPDPVNPGQILTLSGYAIPDSTVTIENQKDGSSVTLKKFTTTSNSSGAWSITVDTDNFSNGTYKTRAKSAQVSGSISTDFSGYTFYGVGQEADTGINADLNRDGKVNLIDFSILLFWWGGTGGDSDPPADINGDGRVSLTDFSILLFNWSG